MDFFDCTSEDISSLYLQHGVSLAHVPETMKYVYRHARGQHPAQTPNLPHHFAKTLSLKVFCGQARLAAAYESKDDRSVKMLVTWPDGSTVETVIIPEARRITLCLSSQVGCRQACSFCHTGRMGLIRQLSAGEIIAQLMLAYQWLAENPQWYARTGLPAGSTINNIVFMGMGEPLDNLEALKKAIAIMVDPSGLGFSPRKVSVSTAGHVDGLLAIARHFPTLSIAVSLHATTDQERQRIMPIAKRWPMNELMAAIDLVAQTRKQGVLVQYTVIRGVNDSLAHAERLAALLRGKKIKVNLIPLNEIEPSRFRRPEKSALQSFRDSLHQLGLRVMVRYSKGQDIQAACGQLVDRQHAI